MRVGLLSVGYVSNGLSHQCTVLVYACTVIKRRIREYRRYACTVIKRTMSQ